MWRGARISSPITRPRALRISVFSRLRISMESRMRAKASLTATMVELPGSGVDRLARSGVWKALSI
jgi:hypothetical protein